MNMIEIDICPGYFINKDAEIYSEYSRKFLTPGRNKYSIVGLKNIDGVYKNFSVHRLMAYIFLGLDIMDKSTQVDHINRDRYDNRLSNLRLVSCHENMLHRAGRFGVDTDTHKLCAKCKSMVPRWNFSKSASAFDGLQNRCKSCNRLNVHRFVIKMQQ